MGDGRYGKYGYKRAYNMCTGKKKLKSGEAGKMAGRFGQRKYECPLCGHWHLTKERYKP